jgi:DNA-binding transcriptional ArsR family regulator
MDVFAALADPVRRSLLLELSRGSARVVDLAADRPISRPAVSRHLRLLSEAGLTVAEDRGRERHYSVRIEALTPVADFVTRMSDQPEAPFSASALDALDLEVRRTVRERRTEQTEKTRRLR